MFRRCDLYVGELQVEIKISINTHIEVEILKEDLTVKILKYLVATRVQNCSQISHYLPIQTSRKERNH